MLKQAAKANPIPGGMLTAREAAAELNVNLATLYAYVSRGLLRSQAGPGGSRARLYPADDVRSLRGRKALGRDGAGRDGAGFSWGAPILDSALTLISDGKLYWRGRDAEALIATASLETVAGLLWGCEHEDPFRGARPALGAVEPELDGAARCVAQIAHAWSVDQPAYNLQPAAVARSGARLVRLMAHAFAGLSEPLDKPVHEILARGWKARDPAAVDLIRAGLVAAADHELNASTFAVRVAASTGANPYACALAGLAALSGPRHGGVPARVGALLREIDAYAGAKGSDPRGAIVERLQRGESIPGFGHPLYDAGDPRAVAVFARLERAATRRPGWAQARATIAAVRELTGVEPNIDFALASLGRAFDLPPGAPFAIFAVRRTVGWIAHAIEQYGAHELLRPRSRYVGEPPAAAKPAVVRR